MALVNYSGVHGSGKTSLAVGMAAQYAASSEARTAYRMALAEINVLNQNGYNYTLPPFPLIYANFPMLIKRGKPAYEFDASKMRLAAEDCQDTAFIPPYSYIIIDEAQMDLDSHKSASISPEVRAYLQAHRHNGYNMHILSQRSMDLFNGARELGARFIHLYYNKPVCRKNFVGRRVIAKVKWRGLEFDDWEDYAKRANGRKFKHTFNGNVFKLYDHQHLKPFFFRFKENVDFDRTVGEFTELSRESFKRYNDLHPVGSIRKEKKNA